MQDDVLQREKLINNNGELTKIGFFKDFNFDYNKDSCKISKSKLKEEDLYVVYNHFYAFIISVSNISKTGIDSVALIDLANPWIRKIELKRTNSKNEVQMPLSPNEGDINVKEKNYTIIIKNTGNSRRILCHLDDFHNDKPIDADISVIEEPSEFVVTTETVKNNEKLFVIKNNINCMKAHGIVRFQNKEYILKPDNSCATLHWSRGVNYSNNNYYNFTASGYIDGKLFGFNIGCDIKNNDKDIENAIFYDGYIHKLSKVELILKKKHIKSNMNNSWILNNEEKTVNLVFKPNIDCFDEDRLLNKHMVFGTFNGEIIMNDGTILNIQEFTGFVLKHNK
ncbi:DUF2804 domain-containing protein [Sedimentibacter sp. zth1]|uniref:DUF2804 domain-containing protein n=1 Tax=Sedimentibacter sp. zth1 TaxID=2816908 RepID=UPI001A924924|nr:DUF2804 domain-containing protein [Sedimentibacter sp. zth1]QSX05156.1 DUF2804 domain-containing protein [Sedimentibacter sp. zth1]